MADVAQTRVAVAKTPTRRGGVLNQERIVLGLAVLLFALFSVTLPGFLTAQNIITLLRSVSVLAILGIGMVVVVLGRGIDLSMIANMAISVAWAFFLANHGTPVPLALAIGFGFAILMGAVTGFIVAYAEVPPLFATLAMGTFIYGFGRSHLVKTTETAFLPLGMGVVAQLGQGTIFHVPISIIAAAVLSLAAYLFLRTTKYGCYVYAIGDNIAAARIGGAPVRPILVMQYVISGAIAFVAGLITATAVSEMNTRIVNSTMIYDVILVVVLGGVGLSGGRGGVRNVIVGTLLIGTLIDGMTIMDLQYTVQNVIKSLILLFAIIADSLINPRDEQTSQQGDI